MALNLKLVCFCKSVCAIINLHRARHTIEGTKWRKYLNFCYKFIQYSVKTAYKCTMSVVNERGLLNEV